MTNNRKSARPILFALLALLTSIALYAPQASSEPADVPTPVEASAEPTEPTAPLRIALRPATHDVEGGPEQIPTSTTIPPTTTTTEAPTTTKAPIATTATGECGGYVAAVSRYFPSNQVAKACSIIKCETGGTFSPSSENPSSTASGLFQFLDGTWESTTGTPAPASNHSAEAQIAAGAKLWQQSGWSPWSCA